jgi:hypothetical protein
MSRWQSYDGLAKMMWLCDKAEGLSEFLFCRKAGRGDRKWRR